jgi:predicted esterase
MLVQRRYLDTPTRLGLASAVCLCAVTFVQVASAQTEEEIKAKFSHGSHTHNDITVLYRLFSPEGYSEDELYPLVLSLHGGSGGSDNEKQLDWRAATSWADTVNQNRQPSFVIAPRAPENTKIFYPEVLSVIVDMLDMLQSTYPINPDRVYVTGYSNGGIATMRVIETNPHRFAAAIPMSGWGDLSLVGTYAHVPIWAFHGRLDDVIRPDWMRTIFQTLADMGLMPVYTHCRPEGNCDATSDCELEGDLLYRRHLYTEFGNEGHAMWLLAYNDQRMIDWTYRQRRRTPSQVQAQFEVAFDVDVTFELDSSRRVGVLGDQYPLSDPHPFPLCDEDGDEIYGATVAFEAPLGGSPLTYRYTHSAEDGTDIVQESLTAPRSLVLTSATTPIVFWNDEHVTVPSAPILLRPDNGGLTFAETTLEWRPGEVGGLFQVQVATDSSFTHTVYERLNMRSRMLALEGLDTLRTHYWRVRASNVAGPGEWGAASFTTIGNSPDLIEPLDGASVSENVVLRWSTYPDATRYYLQLSENSDFAGVSTKRLSDTEYHAESLTPGVTYFWRVKASTSPFFSGVWSFSVSSLGRFIGHWDVTAISDDSGTVDLPDIESMQIELRDNGAFTWFIDAVDPASDTRLDGSYAINESTQSVTFGIVIPGLGTVPVAATYTFADDSEVALTVGPNTAALLGPLFGTQFEGSVLMNLKRSSVGVGDPVDVPRGYALSQNYPNPFNPTTTISYALPHAADVTLTVVDVLGRHIGQLTSGTKPAGTYEVTFSATGLSSGACTSTGLRLGTTWRREGW